MQCRSPCQPGPSGVNEPCWSVAALDLIRGFGRSWTGRPFWGELPGHGRERRESAGRAGTARGGPAFDLVASKFRRPLMRPGTVGRLPLIERLTQDDPRPIVSVVAPPGYGKTTLLSQWAERNGQSFAWVSVEEPDNDPKVLLTYIAAALDAIEPVDERVFDALASPGSSVPGSVVPRLGRRSIDDLTGRAGLG